MFTLNSKAEAEDSIKISKDIVEVFEFVALDFVADYPQWSPEVDEVVPLSDGPMQVGYKINQRRVENSDVTESVLTVTVMQPNTRFCYEGDSEPYVGHYSFEECTDGSGTELTFRFHLDDIEVTMRPFIKLIRTAMKEGVTQTLQNIKEIIETEEKTS